MAEAFQVQPQQYLSEVGQMVTKDLEAAGLVQQRQALKLLRLPAAPVLDGVPPQQPSFQVAAWPYV